MFKGHKKIERNLAVLLILTFIVTAIGGIVEILPLFKKEIAIEHVERVQHYTPLELAGFYIYKREGCYGCHSQQVRLLVDEVERYGPHALAAESIYDHPFMWGSKRTGPDISRIGEKYSDDWHIVHMYNPRYVVPESIMPSYPFLQQKLLDTRDLWSIISINKTLGHPYIYENEEEIYIDLKVQLKINEDPVFVEKFKKQYPQSSIRKFNNTNANITELDALIAYLQTLGRKVDLNESSNREW